MIHLPQGLYYYENFITKNQEQNLIQSIQGLNWQPVVLFDQIAKRRVVHFGMDYHYGKRTVIPTKAPPEFLKEVMIRGAELLKVGFNDIAEILITEYPINAGIGWHRDSPVFDLILGISLKSSTLIHFRKRAAHQEQYTLLLEPASAYALTGSVRWDWEHRIAPVKQLRYSITLRTLKLVNA